MERPAPNVSNGGTSERLSRGRGPPAASRPARPARAGRPPGAPRRPPGWTQPGAPRRAHPPPPLSGGAGPGRPVCACGVRSCRQRAAPGGRAAYGPAPARTRPGCAARDSASATAACSGALLSGGGPPAGPQAASLRRPKQTAFQGPASRPTPGAGRTLARGARQREAQAQRVERVRQRGGRHARARARGQPLRHRQAAVLAPQQRPVDPRPCAAVLAPQQRPVNPRPCAAV